MLEKIRQLGELNGIDFIGVAPIGKFKKEVESRGGLLVGDFPRALSIGIVLPNSIVDLLGDRNVYENVLQYKVHAKDLINHRLDCFSSLVSSVIQKNSYKAMPIPAAERIDSYRVCASVSHKITARLAGFGWIGKSCLFINPEHGPRVRWTTVLTDVPLEENHSIMENHCGECHQCVNACPAHAIKGRNYFDGESREMRLDVAKCEAYFAELENQNRLPICSMCMYVCPYGKSDDLGTRQTEFFNDENFR